MLRVERSYADICPCGIPSLVLSSSANYIPMLHWFSPTHRFIKGMGTNSKLVGCPNDTPINRIDDHPRHVHKSYPTLKHNHQASCPCAILRDHDLRPWQSGEYSGVWIFRLNFANLNWLNWKFEYIKHSNWIWNNILYVNFPFE